MLEAPEHHFDHDWREVDTFVGQIVELHPWVLWGLHRIDQTEASESIEPVCQDVRRDPLTCLKEISVSPSAGKHQVSNNQQGPSIAEDFKHMGDRAG